MSEETKTFSSRVQIKDLEQGLVSAVVASLNCVDKDGDVLLPGSFPHSANVKLSFYGHDVITNGAAPVGSGVIYERGNQAIFDGRYFMSTERGREAFRTVKEIGGDGSWSFGFPRHQTKTEAMTDHWRSLNARRVISKLNPIEASPVFQAAGISTGTLLVKHSQSAFDPFGPEARQAVARAQRLCAAPPPPAWTLTSRGRAEMLERVQSSHFEMLSALTVVTETKKVTARNWADAVCAQLGLSRCTIKWETSGDALGWFNGSESDTIFLNPILELRQIPETVSHELAHRARHKWGWKDTEKLVERDTADILQVLGA